MNFNVLAVRSQRKQHQPEDRQRSEPVEYLVKSITTAVTNIVKKRVNPIRLQAISDFLMPELADWISSRQIRALFLEVLSEGNIEKRYEVLFVYNPDSFQEKNESLLKRLSTNTTTIVTAFSKSYRLRAFLSPPANFSNHWEPDQAVEVDYTVFDREFIQSWTANEYTVLVNLASSERLQNIRTSFHIKSIHPIN